jgi:hypothetical protein
MNNGLKSSLLTVTDPWISIGLGDIIEFLKSVKAVKLFYSWRGHFIFKRVEKPFFRGHKM